MFLLNEDAFDRLQQLKWMQCLDLMDLWANCGDARKRRLINDYCRLIDNW